MTHIIDEDDVEYPALVVYSKAIWTAFSWISRCTGSLSVIGSSLIIFIIVRGGKEKLSRIHNRLLLCMSCIDVVNSVNLGLGVTLNPHSVHPYIYGAAGNKFTCSLQGFLLTIGFSVPMYNAVLCVYYMAVIRYNLKDDILLKIEPYAHAIALLIPLATAIYGISADLFHPTTRGYCFGGTGCLGRQHLAEGCIGRPWKLIYILDYTFYFMVGLVFLTIVCSMCAIYFAVRAQELKMKKYHAIRRRQSITIQCTVLNDNDQGDNESPTTPTNCDGRNNNDAGSGEETFSQALLYVAAYVSCYTFPVIMAVISKTAPVSLLLCTATFFPLQGLWNFCIYVRPKCHLVKKAMKNISFFQVLRIVVMTKNLDHFLRQERARIRRDVTQAPTSRLQVLETAKKYGLNKNKTETQEEGLHINNNDKTFETLQTVEGPINNQSSMAKFDEANDIAVALEESVFGHTITTDTSSVNVWTTVESPKKYRIDNEEEVKQSEDEILAAELKDEEKAAATSVMWSRIEPINTSNASNDESSLKSAGDEIIVEALGPPAELSDVLLHCSSIEPTMDDDLVVGSEHEQDAISACQSEDIETMFSSNAGRLDPQSESHDQDES